MSKKYIIMLGNKNRELVAKSIVETGDKTFPEVKALDPDYWRLRSYVRKPRKSGGLGLFDADIKKMGISTWHAWPMPEDGTEPGLKKGQSIDADPYHGTVSDEWWPSVMKEYDAYVEAKKAEKEAEKAKPAAVAALPKPTVTKVEQPKPKAAPSPAPAPSPAAAPVANMGGISYALKALVAIRVKDFVSAVVGLLPEGERAKIAEPYGKFIEGIKEDIDKMLPSA